jgi:hypothetical protein
MNTNGAHDASPRRTNRGAGVWVPVTVVAGLLLGIVEVLSWPIHPGPAGGHGPGGPMAPPAAVEFFAVFSAIDVALLVALVVVYARTFRETRAQFALGLLVFLLVLLFEAFASSPFVFALFGLQPGNLGPFLLLGAILEMVALVIFLALSLE